MLVPALLACVGIAILVVATSVFVNAAGRVATGMKVSPVLVGAVILGCGIGLPELTLAFQGDRHSPLRELLGLGGSSVHGTGILISGLVLALVLTYPIVFPSRMTRHSPLILAATVMFAALLRGSLDRTEGVAMLVGFVIGLAWVLHRDESPPEDPWAPIIDDDYEQNGAFVEAPVMTPLQLDLTRAFAGLLLTLIGAQLLARSAETIVRDIGYNSNVQALVLVALGSVLPHVVVAFQALRKHHEALAVGNLIGSNLFHTLAIGGAIGVIKPYESGGAFGPLSIVVLTSTAVITFLLLRSEDELSRRDSLFLVAGYVVLTAVTVT